jgi:alpha-ribazole phosphatase
VTPFVLHLLRHGAPALPGRLMGRTDCEATHDGIAACVARAAELDVAHILSSDLQRARRAADAIADPRALKPAIDPRWRELDFGAWDGMAPEDVETEALQRFWDDPEANPPPEGERWSDLTARVSDAIAALEPVPTLVVTHGGAIRAALHLLCGFGRETLWAFDLPYAALVSLRIWRGEKPTAQITGLRI